MKTQNTVPQHLLEATRYFQDPDVCVAFVEGYALACRGVQCPQCGGKKVSYLSSRRICKCMAKDCHKQFCVKVGTIFEDSAVPLDKWLMAVWLSSTARTGSAATRSCGIWSDSKVCLVHAPPDSPRSRMAPGDAGRRGRSRRSG